MKKRHEIERFFDKFEALMNRMGTEMHYVGYPRKVDMEEFGEKLPVFEEVAARQDWKESDQDLQARAHSLNLKLGRLRKDMDFFL